MVTYLPFGSRLEIKSDLAIRVYIWTSTSSILLFSARKQAVRWELISKSPEEAVDPIREPDPDTTVREPAEAERFLDSVQNDRLYAAFYLMYATGVRRGELLGLRWDDLRDNGLRIDRSLVLVNNHPTFKEPKTKRSRRFIPVGRDAIEILEAHRQRQTAEREACDAGWDEHGLLFPTTVGTPSIRAISFAPSSA